MVGIFEIIDVGDKKTSVVAFSHCNESILGWFYIPPFYRDVCRTLKKGDVFFGLLDETAGYGYVCYIINDGVTNDKGLVLGKGLSVKETIEADAVKAKTLESDTIKSAASNCSFTLTADHCAAIVASTQSGAPVPITHLDITLGG